MILTQEDIGMGDGEFVYAMDDVTHPFSRGRVHGVFGRILRKNMRDQCEGFRMPHKTHSLGSTAFERDVYARQRRFIIRPRNPDLMAFRVAQTKHAPDRSLFLSNGALAHGHFRLCFWEKKTCEIYFGYVYTRWKIYHILSRKIELMMCLEADSKRTYISHCIILNVGQETCRSHVGFSDFQASP
jgi:hypothetical protein